MLDPVVASGASTAPRQEAPELSSLVRHRLAVGVAASVRARAALTRALRLLVRIGLVLRRLSDRRLERLFFGRPVGVAGPHFGVFALGHGQVRRSSFSTSSARSSACSRSASAFSYSRSA